MSGIIISSMFHKHGRQSIIYKNDLREMDLQWTAPDQRGRQLELKLIL